MKATVFCVLLSLILGCEKNSDFELTLQGGKLYRLDKRSGQVSVIEGSKILPLEEATTDVAKDAILLLRNSKTWPQIFLPQVDSLRLNLTTRWREGDIYFIFTVSPYNQRLRDAHQAYPGSRNFKLRLLDEDGFVILEKQVDITDMARIVDQANSPTAMQFNSHVTCSAEVYLAIKQWTCVWQL